MIRYKTLSRAGNQKTNKDFVGTMEKQGAYCFVLADGIGDYPGKEGAAEIAVKTVIHQFVQSGFEENFLKTAFKNVQETLLKKQQELGTKNGMKTTLVILCIDKDKLAFGHVGNSRCYLFEDGTIERQTLDQSLPQMLVNLGNIKKEDIRNHPQRNQLLCAMGEKWAGISYEIEPDILRRDGQALLLCSDGFWELIEEEQMCQCLEQANSSEGWLAAMEKIVTANGKRKGLDNYSAIAIWTNQDKKKSIFQRVKEFLNR